MAIKNSGKGVSGEYKNTNTPSYANSQSKPIIDYRTLYEQERERRLTLSDKLEVLEYRWQTLRECIDDKMVEHDGCDENIIYNEIWNKMTELEGE